MRIGKYDYVFVCNYKDFIVYALNEDGNLGQVFMLEKDGQYMPSTHELYREICHYIAENHLDEEEKD